MDRMTQRLERAFVEGLTQRWMNMDGACKPHSPSAQPARNAESEKAQRLNYPRFTLCAAAASPPADESQLLQLQSLRHPKKSR